MTYPTHIAPELMHEWIAEARREAAQFRIRSRPDLAPFGNRRKRRRSAL